MVANGRAGDLVGCWQGWKSSHSSKRSSGGRECTANNERMPPKSYSLRSFSERFFPGYPKGALQGTRSVHSRTSGLEVPGLQRKVANSRLEWSNWTRVTERFEWPNWNKQSNSSMHWHFSLPLLWAETLLWWPWFNWDSTWACSSFSRLQLRSSYFLLISFLFHFDTLATKDCLIFRSNLRPGHF